MKKETDKIFKDEIYKFNDTGRRYFLDLSIHKLLESCAVKFRGKKVLFYKNNKLTFDQLNRMSNRISNLLIKNGTNKEEIVAVLMNRSPEMIGSIFAILKAGGAYLPIDPNWPKNRIIEIIDNARVGKIIVSKEFIDIAENMLWESHFLKSYICTDSDRDFSFSLKEREKEQRDLWNYVAENSVNDMVGGAGWKTSYGKHNFSKEEIDELVQNVYLKLKPFLDNDKKVLEIGCGTGLVLDRIAPIVNFYHGIDISENAIKIAESNVRAKGYKNVKLETMDSDGIRCLKKNSYDAIIINSVTQFFPSFGYLNNFLRETVSLLKEGGVLFLGDIRDKGKQIDYYKSLVGEDDKNFILSKFSLEKE